MRMARVRLQDGTGEMILKYLVEDMDRHGNVRLYVRQPGRKKIRLRAIPGTDEFLQEYRQALGKMPATETRQPLIGKTAVKSGSFHWLCAQYYASGEFRQLDPRTRRVRRLILDKLCEHDGDKPFALMEPRHIRKRRDEKAGTPEAANGLVKALRQVFNFAVEYELAERNPAKEVRYLQSNSDGHHSWSIEEVCQFERHHPVGTKARLALALLLYTGQRRSDVVGLGPAHLKDKWITLTQAKNQARKAVTLSIPVLPELQSVLDRTPCGPEAFLTTQFGRPFTSNGFGNWFRKRCDEAGLPQCTAHGLRKAGASIAAENGATERQLMAIFGWTTMKEAARYTRAARQKVLAGSAMGLLVADQKTNETVPLLPPLQRSGTVLETKPLKTNENVSGMVPRGGIEPPTRGFSVRCSTD
jgi:integrase